MQPAGVTQEFGATFLHGQDRGMHAQGGGEGWGGSRCLRGLHLELHWGVGAGKGG